jgi:hypothetical protein
MEIKWEYMLFFQYPSAHTPPHASQARSASAPGRFRARKPIRLAFQKDVSGFPPVSARHKNGVAARGRTI